MFHLSTTPRFRDQFVSCVWSIYKLILPFDLTKMPAVVLVCYVTVTHISCSVFSSKHIDMMCFKYSLKQIERSIYCDAYNLNSYYTILRYLTCWGTTNSHKYNYLQ